MATIPLVATFPEPLEIQILMYLGQNELVSLSSPGSSLERRIWKTFNDLIQESNRSISELGNAVVGLKAHPDFQMPGEGEKETILTLFKKEAEQSRRLNALLHTALMSYIRLDKKAFEPDRLDNPIVEQIKRLHTQKERVAEVALTSLAASPSICDLCSAKTKGKQTVLCATVRITLMGPKRDQQVFTVHAEATRRLKERTPADLEVMDDSGAPHTYWVLPVQEKQHQSFPQLFPVGPFHTTHAKMIADAYRTHCT